MASAEKQDVEIESHIVSTYDNKMGKLIAQGIYSGFELMCPPVFTHLGEPSGKNGAAVGYRHPHFLVLMIKKP